MAARENLLFTADAAAELHLCPSAAVSPLDGSTATFKTYTVAVGNVGALASSVASTRASASSSAGLVLGALLDTLKTVVAVESLLIGVGQVAALVEIRSILDAVLSECEVQVAILQGVAAQRDDGVAATEQTVGDGNEVRLAGGVVDVYVLDTANLVTVHVVSSCVCKIFDAVEISHFVLNLLVSFVGIEHSPT